MTGHDPLVTGHVSGDPEPGWLPITTGGFRRCIPGSDTTNEVVVAYRHGGWAYCHEVAGVPSEWAGCAPTCQQAQLDADHHARCCQA